MPRLAAQPQLEDVTLVGVKPSPRLQRVVDQRIEARATIVKLEAEIKALDKIILGDLERAGGPLENDEWRVAKVDSESTSISKERLLSLGVKPTTIARATKVTPYSYPKITIKKNGGGK